MDTFGREEIEKLREGNRELTHRVRVVDGEIGWQYLRGTLIYPFLNNDMNILLRWPLTLCWKSQWVPAILKPRGFNYSSIIPITTFFHHRTI